MAQNKDKWKTDLVWFLAGLFVVAVTIGFGYIGLVIGYVFNQDNLSAMFISMGVGAVVGLGLSIGLILAIKKIREWNKRAN